MVNRAQPQDTHVKGYVLILLQSEPLMGGSITKKSVSESVPMRSVLLQRQVEACT